jgi:hypothetical protein
MSFRKLGIVLLGLKAKTLLTAAVLCWVIGIIIALVVLSTPMPLSVAGPIIGGATGLIVFGVLFLIFAIAVFFSTPRRHM